MIIGIAHPLSSLLRPPTAVETQHIADPMGDEALMLRTARGDHDAFALLVERHEAWARSTAWRILGNNDDAEDAAQEAFIQLWKQAALWRPRQSLRPYLATIITRRSIDMIRRKRPEALDENFEVAAPHVPPHLAIHEQQRRDRMEEALMRLPTRQRAAVLLFHREDMSLAEGAAALEISPKAFESLLIRGRESLKRMLADTESHR